MNSSGLRASRSCTEARPIPPSMKWMCESMKPGTIICPAPSMIRAAAGVSFRISALDPTAAIRSPATAMALAHGRRGSPVQARTLTTASVTVEVGDMRGSMACSRRHGQRLTREPQPGHHPPTVGSSLLGTAPHASASVQSGRSSSRGVSAPPVGRTRRRDHYVTRVP
jgi:hypothetical protein